MLSIYVKKETASETRVALVPKDVKNLCQKSFAIYIESDAGLKASYTNEMYEAAGAKIVPADQEQSILKTVDIVLRISKPEAEDLKKLKKSCLHLSFLDLFADSSLLSTMETQGISTVSLEMIPRITLAQKMDVLSSQTSLAGYYAAVLAASKLNKIFPMMMTPSGTISPAKVFVIGVGVAGLQAIATAKRLGAKVEAFDTRPAVEEQVRSLGAKFVKIDLGETGEAQSGYAQALSPEQIKKQQELQAKVCAQSDVVITTAKLFGRKAPRLIPKTVIDSMKSGSVIIDMAVANGGNVEGSVLNQEVITENGVHILSGDQLERFIPKDASDMFSGNMLAFLLHFYEPEQGQLKLDPKDPILAGCLISHEGQIVHERFKDQKQA